MRYETDAHFYQNAIYRPALPPKPLCRFICTRTRTRSSSATFTVHIPKVKFAESPVNRQEIEHKLQRSETQPRRQGENRTGCSSSSSSSSSSTSSAVAVSKNQNSDAGANVVCKVANRENKFKAVSNPVWICLERYDSIEDIKRGIN